MTAKALFLDRDGIINLDSAYVYQQQDFVFVDELKQRQICTLISSCAWNPDAFPDHAA